jgi:hypothetical protein
VQPVAVQDRRVLGHRQREVQDREVGPAIGCRADHLVDRAPGIHRRSRPFVDMRDPDHRPVTEERHHLVEAIREREHIGRLERVVGAETDHHHIGIGLEQAGYLP